MDRIAGTVASPDGTSLAFDRIGSGPPLVLIDAAGHYRAFSSFDGLIEPLGEHFTVYHYDRRGRGQSTDTAPYAVAREVEDLASLIADGGGSAFLYGFLSGALVALHAAASGVPIAKLAVLEPPIAPPESVEAQAAFTAELVALLAGGQRDAAVEHFLSMVPDEILAEMRTSPSWAAMEAVADTFVYDCLISEATSPALLASITVPTLVIDSTGSDGELGEMAAAVADTLPNAIRLTLPGGWHGVDDEVLAANLVAFFSTSERTEDHRVVSEEGRR